MTAPVSVANDMRLACDDLNRRGYRARLTAFACCGDVETRLVVRGEHTRTCLELRAPSEDQAHDRWYAVRISSGRRTVWCGPQRSDTVSGLDLVPFLTDLMTLTDAVLRRRYRPCEAGS